MHIIEEKVLDFLEKLCYNKIPPETISKLSEDFGKEVARRLEETLTREKSKEFTLRMSNIGKDLRMLLLEKKHGRVAMNPSFLLKMTYGHLYEALFVCLIKYSGLEVQEVAKKVSLKIDDNITINGEYDLLIEGKIYDVKTASQYAYQYKFVDYETLKDKDDFGYFGQGFGYCEADDTPFGGWIVIDKSTGAFKVIEIPRGVHKSLREHYVADNASKAKHITYRPDDIPECKGVVEETFNGKPTGNKYLNKTCEWCPYKDGICHRKITHCADVNSKAKNKVMKYYVGVPKS